MKIYNLSWTLSSAGERTTICAFQCYGQEDERQDPRSQSGCSTTLEPSRSGATSPRLLARVAIVVGVVVSLCGASHLKDRYVALYYKTFTMVRLPIYSLALSTTLRKLQRCFQPPW